MNKNYKKQFRKLPESSSAFTIIEMVVVMAVFLFIIGAGLVVFIEVVKNQRKVLSQQEILNQISYVEEYMSKAIRMAKIESNEGCLVDSLGVDHPGYIYLQTRYDTGLNLYRGIKFINQTGSNPYDPPICQEFFLDNVQSAGTDPVVLNDPNNPLVLKELKNSTDDNEAVAITSPSLEINFAKFSVNGSGGSTFGGCTDLCGASELDPIQPRVTILLNVKVMGDSEESSRTMQTTVSQRNLNVK